MRAARRKRTPSRPALERPRFAIPAGREEARIARTLQGTVFDNPGTTRDGLPAPLQKHIALSFLVVAGFGALIALTASALAGILLMVVGLLGGGPNLCLYAYEYRRARRWQRNVAASEARRAARRGDRRPRRSHTHSRPAAWS